MPGLYLVATPIGNLGDITVRALSVLHQVDRILCEDTRVSSKLLKAYGIKKPLLSFYEHNAKRRVPDLIQYLLQGEKIALISDAGMPLISDPGFPLLQEVIKHNNIPFTLIPGPSSSLMALVLSGLPCETFFFAGFLPSKKTARRSLLASYKRFSSTLVFFESPHRIIDTIGDCFSILGDRPCALARELTKKFEEVKRGTLESLLAQKDSLMIKGEMVLCIGGAIAGEKIISPEEIEAKLLSLLPKMSLKEAAQIVSQELGCSRKEVYTLALRLKIRYRKEFREVLRDGRSLS